MGSKPARAGVTAALVVAFTAGTASIARAEAPPKLTVSEADKVQIVRFDDARDKRSASFSLGIEPAPGVSTPPTPSATVKGDLISEQKRRLPRKDVTVQSIEYNGVDGFEVTLDVQASNVKPGRYTGTVIFGGPAYAQALPVTVVTTLRSGKKWAVGIALLGWIAGLLLKGCTDLFKAPGEKVRSHTSFKRYVFRSGFISTAALGLVGAVAAWGFTYLGSDVWGADDLDELRLAGTALAGVVTGTTVADFFTPFRGPSGG